VKENCVFYIGSCNELVSLLLAVCGNLSLGYITVIIVIFSSFFWTTNATSSQWGIFQCLLCVPYAVVVYTFCSHIFLYISVSQMIF